MNKQTRTGKIVSKDYAGKKWVLNTHGPTEKLKKKKKGRKKVVGSRDEGETSSDSRVTRA